MEEETESCLALIDKFDGRNLRDGYDWNNDIYEEVREFLLTNTNNKHAYQLILDTHASVAFAAGRTLDSKSGINVFPIQKSSTTGTVLWDVKLSYKRNY
ncbi:MAG: SAVED domain-containing protein, partial [Clostridiales bacterium]|nr:SAVED domain-containing protein [Clostridiales bacterium]